MIKARNIRARAIADSAGPTAAWMREHVDHSGDECLIWPFGNMNGYGVICHERRSYYAHRIMCELVNGPAPSGKHHAAHTCGNGHKGCVHPKHLVWKTVSENQLDRAIHGTKSTGCVGKLSMLKARAIRLLNGQMTQAEMAEIFEVSRSQISWVVTGKVWREDRTRAVGQSRGRGRLDAPLSS